MPRNSFVYLAASPSVSSVTKLQLINLKRYERFRWADDAKLVSAVTLTRRSRGLMARRDFELLINVAVGDHMIEK